MTILVVGAGFSGATVARVLAESGYQVHVVDKRGHVAGNAYDEVNHLGIRVHRYGPHLFHTKSERVWNFLSRFTDWIPYEHSVTAMMENGTVVPFPPNARTKFLLTDMRETRPLVDIFYRPYTRKMWGRELEEVAPHIIKRVPARDDYEYRYFPTDTYQGLPSDGYASLVESMLDHDLIEVDLNTHYAPSSGNEYQHVFSTMPIDVFYGLCHGPLDYRSIKFHTYDVPMPRVLETSVMNFTHDGPYTRVTEWKNLPGHGENPHWTTLTFEEPCDYRDNDFERYYPVSDESSRARLELYKSMREPWVTHLGRCGSFAYLDMDQAVNQALQAAEKFLGRSE